MGLRYVAGNDPANPATDYFSLGQGTPQVWEPNVYAAGTAVCGTAEIAADQVPAILGSGNETQFQFQGVISSQKPFRDWLAQVLDCCLGFCTWEFGKLKLGCRINASAVDAYIPANMLFQSLRLTPIQASFEHMVLSFADVAYQYQANTAEYCDKTHAAYYGRAGSPLTTQRHSARISTLSQALRICGNARA